MEQRYLIDSNVVIDYLDNKLPENKALLIDAIDIQISVITRMEILSWSKATTEQMKILELFINGSTVFNLDEAVIINAIEIRKKHKIKLPDAIIAATALTFNFTLITSNTKDFKNIPKLNILS